LSRVHVQPQAVADSDEAAAWYERRQTGLGIQFILELDAAIDRAISDPVIYEMQYRQARRVLLRRFPYAVYFVHRAGSIEVFAVLHQQRDTSAGRQERRSDPSRVIVLNRLTRVQRA